MDGYSYDDCPLPGGHIRILFLKPGIHRNSDIVMDLRSYSIDEIARNPDDYRFTALSYSWGDGNASKDVFVCTDSHHEFVPGSGPDATTDMEIPLQQRVGRLKVRPNLHEFLREFRDDRRELALWVDDISVNQKDTQERSDQVPRMGTIYSTADTVSIWLGPADEDGKTDRAMDFIKTILQKDGTEELFVGGYARAWSELLYLMRREWFSRRWIIQEVALARSAEIRCGSKVINWSDFSDAVSIFTLNIDTILKTIKREPEQERSLEGITDARQLGAVVLVDVLSNPYQSLESLVSSLSTFAVTDPRDTIYTLLSLAKENTDMTPKSKKYRRPEPDYEANLLQVYTRFVQWCVQESESLDILCRHWAFPELEHTVNHEYYPDIVKLPSWIKTVDNPAYGAQKEGFGSRRTGDGFVGTPESRHYNASLGMSPVISYGMDQGPSNQNARLLNGDSESNSEEIAVSHLSQQPMRRSQIYRVKRPQLDLSSSITVKGRCIGQITKAFLMPKGIIPKQVLQNLGYHGGTMECEAVPDILWRTLVADRGPDGKGAPSWYQRACMTCLTDNTGSGHMDTNSIIPQEDGTKLKVEFARRVQTVCWNRTFVDCGKDDAQGDRLVGIGPPDSRADDLVCILYGLSVPCILRPTWRGGGDDYTPDYFKFVGEAFILGQMDGEAIKHLSNEELEGQDFRIL
ncbi:heterokaryon incompatibility protein-domain-containing protein [Hypoxylon sp. FL1150]|nr:heterokaryon incompatibility protein-domain-containing protein [Hypoxylon sp. FL1150]